MDFTPRSLLSLATQLPLLPLLRGVQGQTGVQRGDVAPEGGLGASAAAQEPCSCSSSVIAAVIITSLIFLLFGGVWWCLQERSRRKLATKPDLESLGKAAYDNPQFVTDEEDLKPDGDTKICMEPGDTTAQTCTKSTATNTTATLERGKSTLERVMAAVMRGSRSDPKRAKDDSCFDGREVIVPLQGHDFAGLGFTVDGNLKDGLFVKEVMSRGPASQSGDVTPGDRILALTVLTDHVVFKDALTILSYASPYPVLLHLKKKSSFTPRSSKTKLNSSSNSSVKLVHPAFRSLSSGDLSKIGDIDIKRVKLGNLIPPSKGKSIEVSKQKVGRLAQRKIENRHSERAIDVPGVDIKPNSVVVDIEAPDKSEFANVQVHRPMMPKLNIDTPDTAIDMPNFTDANLTLATENLQNKEVKINVTQPKIISPNAKTKFGVKVFPDLGFQKNKDVEASGDFHKLDLKGDLKGKAPKFETENIEILNNKQNSAIELKVGVKSPEFETETTEGKLEGKDFKMGMPNFNMPSLNIRSKTSKEEREARSKFDIQSPGINIESVGAQMPDWNASKIAIDDIKIKKSDRSKDQDESDSAGNDTDDNNTKSKFGFNIGMPDINLPTFKLMDNDTNSHKNSKEKTTHELEAPDIDIPSVKIDANMKGEYKDSEDSGDEDKKSKSRDYKFEMPDMNLPSLNFKGKTKETDKSRNFGIDVNVPDPNGPSFTTHEIKVKEDKESGNKEQLMKDKSEFGLNLEMPDVKLPSLSLKGEDDTIKIDENVHLKGDLNVDSLEVGVNVPSIRAEVDKGDIITNADVEEKNAKVKSKQGFKFGMPDMPNFSIKHKDEKDKKSKGKHEIKIDEHKVDLPSVKVDIKNKTNEESQSDTEESSPRKSKKHGFQFGLPNLHMPTLHLKGNKEKNIDIESPTIDANIETPTIEMPPADVPVNDKEDENTSEIEEEKAKKSKSKHGFKFGMPDLPSFHFKGKTKSVKEVEIDPKLKVDVETLDIDLTDLELNVGKVDTENKEINSEKDVKPKSSKEYSIKLPDMNLPSFKAGDKDDDKEYVVGLKEEGFDVKLEEPYVKKLVEVKTKSNENEIETSSDGIKLKMPDIMMPSLKLNVGASKKETDLNMKTKTDIGLEDTEAISKEEINKSKHGFTFGMPDINIPSFNGKGGDDETKIKETKQADIHVAVPSVQMEANLNEKEGEDVVNKKSKSKHGFKFGMPDISMPSFNLKRSSISDSASHIEADIEVPELSSSSKVIKSDLNCDFQSEKRDIEYDTPDVKLPSISLDNKINNDFDMPSAHINTDINIRAEKDGNKKENNDKKSKSHFKIGLPDINMPSFKIRSNSKDDDFEEDKVLEKEKHKNEESEDDIQEKNSKTFKVGIPEIDLPSFKIKSEGKLGDNNLKTESKSQIELNMNKPDIKLDSNLKEVNEKSSSKSKHGFKFGMPDINLPSFKLHGKVDDEGKEIRAEHEKEESNFSFGGINSNISTKNITLERSRFETDFEIPKIDYELKEKPEMSTSKTSENKTDSKAGELSAGAIGGLIKIPNLDLGINKSPETKISKFEIPRVSMTTNSSYVTSIMASKSNNDKEAFTVNSNELSKLKVDSKTYNFHSEYSLPDELKVEVGSRNTLEGVVGDIPLDISRQDIESIALETNIESSDLECEFPEEDMAVGLNITDATKNKRFGYQIEKSEITLPIISKSSKEITLKHAVDPRKNQSDEMKSLSLKMKPPNVNSGLNAESDDSQPNSGSFSFELPRVRTSGNKFNDKDKNIKLPDQEILISTIPIPKVSINSSATKQNESDEWKMKESDPTIPSANVSLLREKFNIKMKQVSDVSLETSKVDFKPGKLQLRNENDSWLQDSTGRIELDDSEPDFIIPDLKSQESYSSSFTSSNFNIDKFKQENSPNFNISNVSNIPEAEMAWKVKQNDEYEDDRLNSFSESEIRLKTNLSPLSTSPSGDINLSMDSSSLDTESDLPEADSDYKKAARDYSLDVPIPRLSITKMNLEKSFIKSSLESPPTTSQYKPDVEKKEETNFGSLFGFQGFKKKSGSQDSEDYEIEPVRHSDSQNNKFDEADHEKIRINKLDLRVTSSLRSDKSISVIKDLPEADYDIDFKIPKINTDVHSKDKTILYSEERMISTNSELPSCNDDQEEVETSKNIDREISIPRIEYQYKPNIDVNINTNNKYTELDLKGIDEESKNDNNTAKDIGSENTDISIKGSNKSDSEETEVESKIITEPADKIVEKEKRKAKKAFSFKGFGKSSSDTEDDNIEKVSDRPMEVKSTEEKVKLPKSGLNFGFKVKNRSSDSEDNADGDKIELNPNMEASVKKTKLKSNLGFGFKNKNKNNEAEHLEQSGERTAEEDGNGKVKVKGTSSFGLKGSKEPKYDSKSESEGGEDEKFSMDSRGDESKTKSRYGIGFGFRKQHSKTSSDSEGGENDEHKVNLDERGSNEKAKEHKSKSLKLGFKGFKSLKGKIQTEINKIRHDSPSSDEEGIDRDEERKKTKKKDKEKKSKVESEHYLNVSEEATLSTAGMAAKENRRKRIVSKPSSSSSSSSSAPSSDDEEKPVELRKKKKSKSKRKEDGKIIITKVKGVNIHKNSSEERVEVSESISATNRKVHVETASANIPLERVEHVTIVRSDPGSSFSKNVSQNNIENTLDSSKYVVVRETKTDNAIHADSSEIDEVIEKVYIDRKVCQPSLMKEIFHLENDRHRENNWGSDGHMELRQKTNGEIMLTKTSMSSNDKKRVLTDSEELKRKAASLGDLSNWHEGSLGTLLERAVSLDLKDASVGHPNLHIRRLQLPDSSATSIDEVDENATSPTQRKMESGGLKSASQWGTLEEAMNLGVKVDPALITPTIVTEAKVLKSTTNEGTPVSNIEISGERGSSITAVSVKSEAWNDSFEDDEIPSLPSSPIPVETTTITLVEDGFTSKEMGDNYSTSDHSIVVVGNETNQNNYNFQHTNFQLSPVIASSTDAKVMSLHGMVSSSNTSINSDSGRYSPRQSIPTEVEDVGGVTITMVAAESHLGSHSVPGQNMSTVRSPLTVPSPLSSPPDLVTFSKIDESPMVTVSHDMIQENGEIVMETSELNISDEFITPDSTPQKSRTQITLDGGVSGYTVMEGPISRTVIISNPESSASPVNIVNSEADS